MLPQIVRGLIMAHVILPKMEPLTAQHTMNLPPSAKSDLQLNGVLFHGAMSTRKSVHARIVLPIFSGTSLWETTVDLCLLVMPHVEASTTTTGEILS